MKLFVLRNGTIDCRDDAVTDFYYAEGSVMGDAPSCPVCGAYVGALQPSPPIRVEVEAWGSEWGDVGFGPGNQILVSQALMEMFIQGGLVGFSRFDDAEIVKVGRKKHRSAPSEPPHYYLASIQRSQAAIDDIASGLIREPRERCQVCRTGGIIKRAQRIVLEPNTWSGEDVFYARGLPGTILVTDRFQSLVKMHDLKNFCVMAAEEFSFDFYPWEEKSVTALQ